MEKPKKVRDAQIQFNSEALSAMGRKGARVANEKRAERRDRTVTYDLDESERAAILENQRRREAVLDSDGKPLAHIDDEGYLVEE